MQISAQSPLTKNVQTLFTLCMAFSLISVHGTYAENVHKILDKDIELTFNGKTITQKTGILHSEIKMNESNTLLIKIESECLTPNPKLKVFLAKGNRPIAAADVASFSNQIEINLANLLSSAKPGDRIVLSFNDDERIMVIPISQDL